MDIEKNAQQTAKNFTAKGIEGLIRNAKRSLAELDNIDAQFGELGREARAASRERHKAKLASAERALEIRKAT